MYLKVCTCVCTRVCVKELRERSETYITKEEGLMGSDLHGQKSQHGWVCQAWQGEGIQFPEGQ